MVSQVVEMQEDGADLSPGPGVEQSSPDIRTGSK